MLISEQLTIDKRKSIYLEAENPREAELLTAVAGGGLWRDDKQRMILRFVVDPECELSEVISALRVTEGTSGKGT